MRNLSITYQFAFLNCFSLPAAPRKKPFLVDKPNDEMVVTSYDALDDYDFM